MRNKINRLNEGADQIKASTMLQMLIQDELLGMDNTKLTRKQAEKLIELYNCGIIDKERFDKTTLPQLIEVFFKNLMQNVNEEPTDPSEPVEDDIDKDEKQEDENKTVLPKAEPIKKLEEPKPEIRPEKPKHEPSEDEKEEEEDEE